MIIHKMYIFEQTLETVATEGGTFWFGFFKNYLETAHVFLFQENKLSIYLNKLWKRQKEKKNDFR